MTTPTYLVLGSTGGIGRTLCERLAKRGVSLVLGGRDPEKLDELAARTGGEACPGDAREAAPARTGMVYHEAIAAAKAGVEGLARSAAASYAVQNVRVNGVAPGLIAVEPRDPRPCPERPGGELSSRAPWASSARATCGSRSTPSKNAWPSSR